MKFTNFAVALLPGFIGKASAKDQGVLVEWEASVDETGDEITKEKVHAVDAAYSDTISLSVKQVVDTVVLDVYDWEEDDSMSMYGGSEMAVLSQVESCGSYAAAGDLEGVSKRGKSQKSKPAGKSSKSVVTSTTSTTSSTTLATSTTSTTSTTTTTCLNDGENCTGTTDTRCCSGTDKCVVFGPPGSPYKCYING
jgi:hypothetical protein